MGCEASKPQKSVKATINPHAASAPNLTRSRANTVNTGELKRIQSLAPIRNLDLSLNIPVGLEATSVPDFRARSLSLNADLSGAVGDNIITTLRNISVPVHRIVLTGGPCAGKSTSLGMLQTKLLSAGFNVYCVPEAATMLVNGGLTWTEMTEDKATLYQLALLRTQIALEDAFVDIARANKKQAVVLCDRGTMDGRAYCSETAWNRIMDLGGYTLSELRDDRYEAVIHMVTAAFGAEQFYTLDTNGARTETPEQARAIDEVLRQKYVGHPRVKIIGNNSTFQEKVEKVWEVVSEIIGIAKPRAYYKRFLVKSVPDDKDITVAFERIGIRITILAQSTFDSQHLLVKRTQGLASYHSYQNISRTNGQKQRLEHRLTDKEYRSLVLQAHPNHTCVHKSNISFTYGSHYYELGTIRAPLAYRGVSVLYVESDMEEDVPIPPFLEFVREVTTEGEFSSYTISQKSDEDEPGSPLTDRTLTSGGKMSFFVGK